MISKWQRTQATLSLAVLIGVESAAKDLVRRRAAAVMLALRDGPQGVAALSSAVGSGQPDVKDVLALLMAGMNRWPRRSAA